MSDTYKPTEVRFGCEHHDEAGRCDDECLGLVLAMSGGDGVPFDETGCSYGGPKPYTSFALDHGARAVIMVTWTPEDDD